MSTSASIVSLGLTEAILRVQAYTFKYALRLVRNIWKTIGNLHILNCKKYIKCLITKHRYVGPHTLARDELVVLFCEPELLIDSENYQVRTSINSK